MQISFQQFEKIKIDMDKVFARVCLKKIKNKFPDGFAKAGVELTAEEETVCKAIKEAKTYGIMLQNDLLLYLECLILLGLDFNTNEKLGWPLQILNDASLKGEEKMNLISENLVFNPVNNETRKSAA